MPLSAGEKLGPYEILALIGSGGMGEVWKARDTRLGRIVAIKHLKPQHRARFEAEARAIAALNHPHICQIHDVGPDYLVLEYIEGQPLASRERPGPFAPEEALRLAIQIAKALEEAHSKGILHRDLKPGNILLTPQREAKLLDFGLAKLAAGDTDAEATETIEGALAGTVCYMSPEQAQGKPLDARSDIFSFGAVLYEMLTGRRAFGGDSTACTLASVLRDHPPLPGASTEIESILARCLCKQPSDRFQSAAELRAALEDAARGRTERTPSIAVLPFVNLSADKDNEYFSDGLAEEILNALTQLPGLRVIARASAFRFRGEQDLRKVGETLQVASVLTGSVRRVGNRVRVGAQLIHVADESQLWSDRYDRELHDIFDIQDEIAQAIVTQLKVKLGARTGQSLVKRYTENLEAHSLYLKGNFHIYRFTVDDMEKGRRMLEQAVAIEPRYAPAWVQLADYYIANAFFCQAPPRDLWPKAALAARKAVEADPELAEAQAVLGWAEALSAFRWDETMRRLDLALRLNPASARSHFWRACTLNALNRVREAASEYQKATDLDPLSSLFRAAKTNHRLRTGRPEEVVDETRLTIEILPGDASNLAILGEAQSLLGLHDEAIAALEKARQNSVWDSWITARLAWAYVRGSRRAEAERLREEMEAKRRERYISPTALAIMAAALGDAEGVLAWMDKSIVELDPNLQAMIRSPYFQALNSDRRYHDILRRMNLQP